jgi:hypothetical protein
MNVVQATLYERLNINMAGRNKEIKAASNL